MVITVVFTRRLNLTIGLVGPNSINRKMADLRTSHDSIEPSLAGRQMEWLAAVDGWAYAHGGPIGSAVLKRHADDFKVTEIIDFTASGEGEHIWLDITKVRCNTEQVAKAIARFAGVAYREVSYAGLKDFHAVTRQWFSLRRPTGARPNWAEFGQPGVTINNTVRHHKKLKRGGHKGNQFEILLRDISGDIADLNQRLITIQQGGVPNYFGPQRFGREAGNMPQAYQLLVDKKKFKNRGLRGLLMSSARSWLFNTVVSSRVAEHSWDTLMPNEPSNLHGSNSVFIAEQSEPALDQRLAALDIHPTAPLWGDGHARVMSASVDLHAWEQRQLRGYTDLMQGLENARLDYQRRATRSVAENLTWSVDGGDLNLSFALHKGQFATSVVRELVTV